MVVFIPNSAGEKNRLFSFTTMDTIGCAMATIVHSLDIGAYLMHQEPARQPAAATPPQEGNFASNSPPVEGWQPQADGLVPAGWLHGKYANITLNHYMIVPNRENHCGRKNLENPFPALPYMLPFVNLKR
ncbi:MAG: hypothetical protein FWG50_00310 [Kiritimatiellaeota bacterium]|nr:hypothetical protein [Kiritimatiellota bacterium]